MTTSIIDLVVCVRHALRHLSSSFTLECMYNCMHFTCLSRRWSSESLVSYITYWLVRIKVIVEETLGISDSKTPLFSLAYLASVCQNFIFPAFSGFWKEKIFLIGHYEVPDTPLNFFNLNVILWIFNSPKN